MKTDDFLGLGFRGWRSCGKGGDLRLKVGDL